MPPKKFHADKERGYVGDKPVRTKKAVPFVYPDWLVTYWRDRDRCLWKLFENSRKEIEERYEK